jgi:translocator protein
MEQYNVIIHLNKVKNMKPIFKLLIAVFIPLAVGALSGYFTSSAISGWYATLNKPFFNPPNYLFGPVWTVLYIMMGIAYYLVWNSKLVSENKSKAYLFYWVQLFLNFMWSICFFYFQNPTLALVVIVLMIITIASTIFTFRKFSTIAAWLLVPYICWVSFATALNFELWRLN